MYLYSLYNKTIMSTKINIGGYIFDIKNETIEKIPFIKKLVTSNESNLYKKSVDLPMSMKFKYVESKPVINDSKPWYGDVLCYW